MSENWQIASACLWGEPWARAAAPERGQYLAEVPHGRNLSSSHFFLFSCHYFLLMLHLPSQGPFTGVPLAPDSEIWTTIPGIVSCCRLFQFTCSFSSQKISILGPHSYFEGDSFLSNLRIELRVADTRLILPNWGVFSLKPETVRNLNASIPRETTQTGVFLDVRCKAAVHSIQTRDQLPLVREDLYRPKSNPKMGICVCVWLTHFAVQQKLIQHYKTKLQ